MVQRKQLILALDLNQRWYTRMAWKQTEPTGEVWWNRGQLELLKSELISDVATCCQSFGFVQYFILCILFIMCYSLAYECCSVLFASLFVWGDEICTSSFTEQLTPVHLAQQVKLSPISLAFVILLWETPLYLDKNIFGRDQSWRCPSCPCLAHTHSFT